MTTLTYFKYCGNGFGEDRPLQSGERYGIVKDMERSISGYKNLRDEIKQLR